jgi:SAM-dependent methyltransferase
MIFFSVIGILIFLVFIFFVILFFITPFFSRVPFIPVRKKVLGDIIRALDISNKGVLYDLGCGNGRVLFALSKVYKDLYCIGIEKAPFPFLLAKIHNLIFPNKKVSILYGDLFKINVSPATHIFLYLLPPVMNSLLPKLERELKPGTRVVSCDFQFKNKKTSLVLDLKGKSYQLNRKLYVYDF